MEQLILKYRRILVVSAHVGMIIFAYLMSYLTRFESDLFSSQAYRNLFLSTLIPLLAVRLFSYGYFDLFKGLWKYSGLKDVKNIVKASILGTFLFALYIYFVDRNYSFPRSLFILDLAFNILMAGGIRIAVRLYKEGSVKDILKDNQDVKNVLIMGAGDAGEMILREMHNNPRLGYNPVGFIDDDRNKRRTTIHGVSVLGNTRDICGIVKRYEIDEVIIALPSAGSKAMRRIINTCKRADVKFRTLPFISDFIDGNAGLSQIRDVAIEDLLGREVADIDMSLIGRELAGRTVMVTGAAGSIGSELVRQVARFNPKKVVLFERAENDLFHLDNELKNLHSTTRFIPFVGDILDENRLRECFALYKPDYIFHAAAYKHVPMMETNPTEAVKNNVFGTKLLTDMAVEFDAEKFVLISTDKAVRPANVMGATKRIAELILQAKAQSGLYKTQFIAVRFGNVLGSNGSVIPLFRKQIESGGPVTVTDKDITRYFMTIPEASKLVIQAGAMGASGEIFLLEMGDPVKISDLAENLIRLSGLDPYKDIKIEFTGLRPGEKLYEELLTEGEGIKQTHHNKIYVLESPELDYSYIINSLSELEAACMAGRTAGIKSILKKIVPEYQQSHMHDGIGVVDPFHALSSDEPVTIH